MEGCVYNTYYLNFHLLQYLTENIPNWHYVNNRTNPEVVFLVQKGPAAGATGAPQP
jgi:hypothetical protein